MLVGVPKEIKDNEFLVSVIPAKVEELVRRGHQVLVESGVGSGAGLPNAAYEAAGAKIAASASEVFEQAELIVRAALLKPRAPRPTRIRPIWSMRWCITASPTCRAR